jgi:ribose 5-phosphate isomerase
VHSESEEHEIAVRLLALMSFGVGTGTTVQLVPFQLSAKAVSKLVAVVELPTA